MYLAVDIGATKTLLAVFSQSGELKQKLKIKTDHKYDIFLGDLRSALEQDDFKKYEFTAVCCAVPGKVDREKGIGKTFGNLPWKNASITKDLEKLTGTKVLIENDANLAALYEALTHRKYKKVLYITLSTGIGSGFIVDGKIDPTYADSEDGHMVLEHEGKLQKWEDFASGEALVERFGKKAEQLDNPFAWKQYAKGVARGLDALLAVLQPDVVIFGGGVGAHLDKFIEPLKDELKKIASQMVPIPPIIKADKAEEAVIYGCYEFIRQQVR